MMRLKEESLIYSAVVDDEDKDFDPDQRGAWLGFFKSGSKMRLAMSGQMIDGTQVGEVEAIFDKQELKRIRDFIDRHLSDGGVS